LKIEKFEDIESWKEARELVKEIYEITNKDLFKKDFVLCNQIQRAGVSIMANISEGFDSGTSKSFISFLNYSYRSTSEVQSLLYIALDIKYIEENKFFELYDKCYNIKNLIGGFIKYLKSTVS